LPQVGAGAAAPEGIAAIGGGSYFGASLAVAVVIAGGAAVFFLRRRKQRAREIHKLSRQRGDGGAGAGQRQQRSSKLVGNPLHAARGRVVESPALGAKSPQRGVTSPTLGSVSPRQGVKSPKSQGGLTSLDSAVSLPGLILGAASTSVGASSDGVAASAVVANPLLAAAAAAAAAAGAALPAAGAAAAATEAAVNAAPDPPQGWVKKWSESKQKVFYFHPDTGKKSWKLPAAEGSGGEAAAAAAPDAAVVAAATGAPASAPESGASPKLRFSRARTASKLAPKEWAVIHAAKLAGRLTAECDPLTGLPQGWTKEFAADGEPLFINGATGETANSVDGVLQSMGASALSGTAE